MYGTLRDPDRVAAVVEDFEFGPDATLTGLEPVAGEYPTLAPGGRTEGRILRTDEVAAVDRYEGVERGLYVRASVPRADGDGTVDTYVGDPDRLGAPTKWPGEGPFERRVRRYLATNRVTVSVE